MKGLFIPEITAEMFRNGCLESIEALMAEGEIYDIEYDPKHKPERKKGKWVGVKEYCDHLNEKAEREGNGHRFIPSGMNICVYCNQCWESNDRRTTYCPNCGAEM